MNNNRHLTMRNERTLKEIMKESFTSGVVALCMSLATPSRSPNQLEGVR